MDISIYPKKELLAKWGEDRKWYEAAAGEPPRCLRCGKPLPPKLSLCALSRYIDVQICPGCGTEEAMLDWDGKALPLWKWHAVLTAGASVAPAEGEARLVPVCGFSEVFEQPRCVVCGHPNGFPMSELCYARADYDGYRWHTTWTRCRELPKDAMLIGEVDGFYDALLALPEFENLHALAKACKSYAELPAAEDRSTYNLFAETPHFYVWLRLINRERDYNLYCHYYYKEPPGEDR